MKKKLFISMLIMILLSAILTSSYNAFAGQINTPKAAENPDIQPLENVIATPFTEPDSEKNVDIKEIDVGKSEIPPIDKLSTEELTENKGGAGNEIEKTNQSSISQKNQQNEIENAKSGSGAGNQYRNRGRNTNSSNH